MIPYGPVWFHMVSYGDVSHKALYGPVWPRMVIIVPVCSSVVMYGPIWPHMASCGPVCLLRVNMFAFVQLTQLLNKFCVFFCKYLKVFSNFS